MPRFSFLALVTVAIGVALIPAIDLRIVTDPDYFWHLRTGEWIVEHHRVPRTDPFSRYGSDKPLVAYSWLFEVLLYGLHTAFGVYAPLVYTTVLWTVIGAVVVGIAGLPGIVVFAIAAPAFATPRPWLCSMLLFATELALLRDPRRRWWLVPVFVLWANLHIQFVYGLAVLAIAALFERRWWPVLAACGLATFLNPYGYGVHATALIYAGQSELAQYVTEMRPPDPHAWNTWTILLAGAMAGWFARRDPRLLLTLALGAVLFLRSRRDGWVLVLCAVAALPAVQIRLRHAAVVAAAAFSLVLPKWIGTRPRLEAMLAAEYPIAAIERVQQLPGPLYNTFNWGGYLIWALRSHPVQMDGRSNVHGAERMMRSFRVWSGKASATSDPEFVAAKLIIAPRHEPLSATLLRDGKLRVVFQDQTALVFAGDTRTTANRTGPHSRTGAQAYTRIRSSTYPASDGTTVAASE